MDVPLSTLERLIHRPPIEPSVADNLWRLLADSRNEQRRNDVAFRHNSATRDVDKLIPYQNRAYLDLTDAIDRLCRKSRGEM
jgi:hypothetical protein